MRKITYLLMAAALTLTACGGSDSNTTLYDVSVTISPDGAGTIIPAADSTYEKNQTVNLQAQPNDEYLFTGWNGDVESSENPLALTMDKAYGLTATFERKNYELAVATEGEGTVSEEVVEQNAKEYDHGTVVKLTATPDEGYKFVEWTGDLTGTENPTQVTVHNPTVVTAVFEPKTFAVTIDTTGKGTVSFIPDQPEYEHGTVVVLHAIPDEDYWFMGWGGDLSGTTNPTQITVDGPKEVTANFESLFYLADNGVTILCPEADIEESGTVGGVTYTKRSKGLINIGNAATTCTSGITDMSRMFWEETFFRGDISHWDVSSVTDMNNMFYFATTFNGDISHWDVSNVVDMNSMFMGAGFNGDISGWDVSSVTNMSQMFQQTTSFNQDLNDWNVSNVENVASMFWDAEAFNGDISGWNVSSVTSMYAMFASATSFNQDLSSWNVSNVTNMGSMFYKATVFDQDLSGWCVSHIGSEPSRFADDAGFDPTDGVGDTNDAEKMPVWGTCPTN